MNKGVAMGEFNPTKYKNDFNRETYDRMSINVPKGEKETITKHWKSKGFKSLNTYVNHLIQADMKKPPEDDQGDMH